MAARLRGGAAVGVATCESIGQDGQSASLSLQFKTDYKAVASNSTFVSLTDFEVVRIAFRAASGASLEYMGATKRSLIITLGARIQPRAATLDGFVIAPLAESDTEFVKVDFYAVLMELP